MRKEKEQGRIHGYQLRTGGQGQICAFPHFSTRADGQTDGRTDGRTDKDSYRVACPQLKIVLIDDFFRHFDNEINHSDGS